MCSGNVAILKVAQKQILLRKNEQYHCESRVASISTSLFWSASTKFSVSLPYGLPTTILRISYHWDNGLSGETVVTRPRRIRRYYRANFLFGISATADSDIEPHPAIHGFLSSIWF